MRNSICILSIFLTSFGFTQIPASTSMPSQIPQGVYFFGTSLEDNNIASSPVLSIFDGKLSFVNNDFDFFKDGRGMRIDINTDERLLLISQEIIDSPGLMEISSEIITFSDDVEIALIGLNSSTDGQFSFINISSSILQSGMSNKFKLYYKPPSGKMLLGIQINNPRNPQNTNNPSVILVDEIIANEVSFSELNHVETEVDGAFEGNLEKLIYNFNNVTGQVVPILESQSNTAIELSIQPNAIAANVGTIVLDSSALFPGDLMSSVKLKPDTLNKEKTIAMVITNGSQNYTIFQNLNDEAIGNSNFINVMGGARFFANNLLIPTHLVLQYSGYKINSTLIIDDLFLSRK